MASATSIIRRLRNWMSGAAYIISPPPSYPHNNNPVSSESSIATVEKKPVTPGFPPRKWELSKDEPYL
ncbi:NADH dehydrogenase [ubiquinone] 1 alpha subcomplex subunit 7 [Varanus komodoensis]|nr:NADH dehydrogenase [ubiquinone] 1 alpha subcomplex subunit 7 [Varanus komodoensis]